MFISGTDRYIDLVNGPQDHGWCFGYTCQERLSTFFTLVATGIPTEVTFTGTNPQKMRLHLFNAENQVTFIEMFGNDNFHRNV